jgi:hypothetical protein
MESRREKISVIKDWVLYERQFMPKLRTRKLYALRKSLLIELGIKLGRDGFLIYLDMKACWLSQGKGLYDTEHVAGQRYNLP